MWVKHDVFQHIHFLITFTDKLSYLHLALHFSPLLTASKDFLPECPAAAPIIVKRKEVFYLL